MTYAPNLLPTPNAAAGIRKASVPAPKPASAPTTAHDFKSVLRKAAGRDSNATDEVADTSHALPTEQSSRDLQSQANGASDPAAALAAALQMLGLPLVSRNSPDANSATESATLPDLEHSNAVGVGGQDAAKAIVGDQSTAIARGSEPSTAARQEGLLMAAPVATAAPSDAKQPDLSAANSSPTNAPMQIATSPTLELKRTSSSADSERHAAGLNLDTTAGSNAPGARSLYDSRPGTALGGQQRAAMQLVGFSATAMPRGSTTSIVPAETQLPSIVGQADPMAAGLPSAVLAQPSNNATLVAESSLSLSFGAQTLAASGSRELAAAGIGRGRASTSQVDSSTFSNDIVESAGLREDQNQTTAELRDLGPPPGMLGTFRLQVDADSPTTHESDRHEVTSFPVTSQALPTQPTLLPPHVTISGHVASPQWASAFSSAVLRMTNDQMSEATLTMSPDELGTISVKIGLDGSSVSVGFVTDSDEVRHAVNAALPVLQEMLAQAGLSLGHSSVSQENGREPPALSRQAPSPTSNNGAEPSPAPVPQPRISRGGRIDLFA